MAEEGSIRISGPEGSIVRYGTNRRAKRVRTNGWQWSEEAEEVFFDALSASCNVCLAAAEAGFTTSTVYRQRQLRPDFAARWQRALEQGYARLEMALVQAAVDSIDDAAFGEDRPIPKMTIEQAMNVLRAHRNEVNGAGRGRPGRRARPPTLDEVRASIEKKVRAIKAARPSPGEQAAGTPPAGAGR